MFSKIKNLLGSIRFWQLTVGAGVEVAIMVGVVPVNVGHIIAAWLASIAVVGTVDKAAANVKGGIE